MEPLDLDAVLTLGATFPAGRGAVSLDARFENGLAGGIHRDTSDGSRYALQIRSLGITLGYIL